MPPQLSRRLSHQPHLIQTSIPDDGAPLCKCLLQDIRGQQSNIFRGRQLGDIGMTVSIASSGSGDLCNGHICNNLLSGQSEWDISIPQSLRQAHDRPHRSTMSRELWSPSSCTTSLTGAHTAMGLMWSGNIMEAHNTQDFLNSEELKRDVRRQIRTEKHISTAAEVLQEVTLKYIQRLWSVSHSHYPPGLILTNHDSTTAVFREPNQTCAFSVNRPSRGLVTPVRESLVALHDLQHQMLYCNWSRAHQLESQNPNEDLT